MAKWKITGTPQENLRALFASSRRPEWSPVYREAIARMRWNALIPPCAVRVERDQHDKGVRYLHPTKGWRRVSDKRLGLA